MILNGYYRNILINKTVYSKEEPIPPSSTLRLAQGNLGQIGFQVTSSGVDGPMLYMLYALVAK